MDTLKIETAENGFIVYEENSPHMVGKQWAFESAYTLSEFIRGWGEKDLNESSHHGPDSEEPSS